jgi:hypothetical protein
MVGRSSGTLPTKVQILVLAPFPRVSRIYRCRGSLTADSKLLGLRAGPRMVAQTGGTHDLYWFGPPESTTLHPVRAAVYLH